MTETRVLLVDTIMFDIKPEQLTEATTDHTGRTIVKGIIQRADARNFNGRVYPREILMREIQKYGEKIKERRALGELDHPDSSVVNLSNTSHNILSVNWKGNDLIGEIEILSTPSGNILKELLKAGITLGISSRGLGSVKQTQLGEGDEEQMADEVQEDFELIAFDFVSDPSTQNAFMRTVNESRNVTPAKLNKYHRIDMIITDILSTNLR